MDSIDFIHRNVQVQAESSAELMDQIGFIKGNN